MTINTTNKDQKLNECLQCISELASDICDLTTQIYETDKQHKTSSDTMFNLMQEIEFVLFQINSNSSLHPEEIKEAHVKSQQILKMLYEQKEGNQ